MANFFLNYPMDDPRPWPMDLARFERTIKEIKGREADEKHREIYGKMSADEIEKLRLLCGDKDFLKSETFYKVPCLLRDDVIDGLPIHERREYEQRFGLRFIKTRDGQRRREVIPGGRYDREQRAYEENARELETVKEELSHYIDTLLGKYA